MYDVVLNNICQYAPILDEPVQTSCDGYTKQHEIEKIYKQFNKSDNITPRWRPEMRTCLVVVKLSRMIFILMLKNCPIRILYLLYTVYLIGHFPSIHCNTSTKIVLNSFSFLCCPSMGLFVLGSVLWCPLRFPHKTMFYSSLPPVVCRRTLVLFKLFVFLCVQWCSMHIVLCFYFVFLRLMLAVSLDWQFLIAPSIFSSVYI